MKNVFFMGPIQKDQFFYYFNFHPVSYDAIYVGIGSGHTTRYMPKGHEIHNVRWKRLLEKHSHKNVITYVFPVATLVEAYRLEIFYIAMLRWAGYDLYNMTAGGEGTFGLIHTPEHIAKRMTAERSAKASKTLKERNASGDIKTGPEKGVYKQPPYVVDKIKAASLYMHASRDAQLKKEINAKISKANTGKVSTESSRQKNREWHLGRKQSQETKDKRAAKNTGKKRSEEFRRLQSERSSLRESKKYLLRQHYGALKGPTE